MEPEWNNGYENNTQGTEWGEEDYAFQTLMKNGRPKTLGWSVGSLVLGIISVLFSFGWSGIILGAAAVVLAVISRKKLGYFERMSVIGLVLGIFGFVLGVAVVIAVNFLITDEMLEEFFKYLEEAENANPIGPGSGEGL